MSNNFCIAAQVCISSHAPCVRIIIPLVPVEKRSRRLYCNSELSSSFLVRCVSLTRCRCLNIYGNIVGVNWGQERWEEARERVKRRDGGRQGPLLGTAAKCCVKDRGHMSTAVSSLSVGSVSSRLLHNPRQYVSIHFGPVLQKMFLYERMCVITHSASTLTYHVCFDVFAMQFFLSSKSVKEVFFVSSSSHLTSVGKMKHMLSFLAPPHHSLPSEPRGNHPPARETQSHNVFVISLRRAEQSCRIHGSNSVNFTYKTSQMAG